MALDVGGVLASDVWETLVLDPSDGLAVRAGVPPDRARDVGADLRRAFSVVPRRSSACSG